MAFKSFIFVLLFHFTFISNIFGQTTAIPDANFEQALIDLNIDSDGIINGVVAISDIIGVNSLVVTTKNISDLTGIEDFSSLTSLDCSDNNLTSLNVNQNKNLKNLVCFFNNITFLQVNEAEALETIKCFNNNLASLNVSQNKNLKLLHGNSNVLTNLNVNGASSLIDLECISNNLSNIDISQNTELINFRCSDNLLTNINIESNTNLETFYCDRNKLSNINLESNSSLTELECWNNQLKTLNISNNINLKILKCNNNFIENLDLSKHLVLNKIICNNNDLKSLNLKNGNNTFISDYNSKNNNDLLCVNVDDINYSNLNWTQKDDWTIFSEDCINIGLPPIAINDVYNTFINSTLNVSNIDGVLSNDSDPEGSALTAIIKSNVINGNLNLAIDGSFTYTPNLQYFGVDTFTYLANNGTLNSNIATVTINIKEVDNDYNLIVPNGFTPNGDQINDYFKPVYKGMKLVHLEIYNTWGNLIFVEEGFNLFGWDGTLKNSKVENGNYLYKIKATTINDEIINYKGLFTLIK